MPDIAWNRTVWDVSHDWRDGGEEWSAPWGGSEAQWFGALLPRLRRRLPARRILEIGPGCGRWTRFLLAQCEAYLGIDLAASCVETCRTRFQAAPHAQFVQNDGLSLSAAPDDSFDLVFSFDSLVHCEIDVLQNYIHQIMRRLTGDGVAFLHHSNLRDVEASPDHLRHARGATVSARALEASIINAGGQLLVQEVIDWRGAGPIDALTTFRRAQPHAPPPIRLLNMDFSQEARLIAAFQAPYAALGDIPPE